VGQQATLDRQRFVRLSDIDFAELYRRQMQRANRHEKTPEYWDGRAPAMSQRTSDSQYVRQFVAAIDLTGCATLLDVGCGPGTIALTVAPRLEHVYGLDYSPGMLAAFAVEARARGLTAATPILRAWEDDWADVPVCDIVVASRSTAVPDLEAAILKVDSKARKRVYMSYPANGQLPGDEVRRAIGRADGSAPDYLCAVGILHHLGLHPTLGYLTTENRFARCADVADFLSKATELLGPLSAEEAGRLQRFFREADERARQEPTRWALFSWEPRKVAR
jgi:SAM-dependent methyltransferase